MKMQSQDKSMVLSFVNFTLNFTKNQYRGGTAEKGGAWTVCRFKGEGGLARKRDIFFGREGADTPMHTMCETPQKYK